MTVRKAQAGGTGNAGRELSLRIASSLVMAAVALALTVAGTWPFAALIGAVGAILCWEWGGLVRSGNSMPALVVHAAGTLAAAAFTATSRPEYALGAIAATAGVLYAMPGQDAQQRLWSASGALYIGLPVIALMTLRASEPHALAAILFLFTVVWGADTAAYFTGRTFGGPKLAPAISPGKTWSGLAGGLALPMLAGAAFAQWLGGTSPAVLALVAGSLALISQLGDLLESFVKRRFKQKDASYLIPGHGGFLDRVDGLIFAAVAAWLLGLLRDPASPAQAFLIWP